MAFLIVCVCACVCVCVCVCVLLCVLHHMFPSVNHCMQKMNNANGSFSVQGTWDTNMAFLAELNEETPKGCYKGEGLS